MLRRLTTTQLVVDIVVSVVWFVFGLPFALMAGGGLLFAVVALLSFALAVRRLTPGISLGLAWSGALLQVLIGQGPNAFDIAIFAVLYATGSYGGPIVRWVGLASAPVGAAVIGVFQWLQGRDELNGVVTFLGLELPASVVGALTSFFGFLVAFLLAWTLGALARVWRTGREARRAEAAAQREVVVEQERNRIARDLHDVVAHSLAVVIAQADGARYSKDAAAKDASLGTIAATSREALGDVRLLLARLRHEEGAEPQPSLADLDALVEQVRASGLEVRLERSGEPLALPPGKQLAAYRIVQEALTNALRHGDQSAPATVRLDWAADALGIEVRNSPAGEARPEGHGLPGMRERAALVGGELSAGSAGSEWAVLARIPA